jgi:FMN reductase (NADPH)/FMN reductase [NAD(P)H]
MNETLEVIEKRRSTRNYADTPISAEEKEAILHAAMRAPTAGNMILYSIIEIDDPALKERLAVTCDNQPFIAKAPLVLLFAADYQRKFDYFKYCEAEESCTANGRKPRPPQEGDMLLACCDALIAAQTAVIAAESLGIGSCYIGDILENYEIHRDLLKLPPYVLPITLVCFGRPAIVHTEKSITPRYDRQFIVFKDAYRRLEADDFEQMMRLEAEHNLPELPLSTAVKELGRRLYLRKFVSDFSVEMTRSAREMIKNWQK